MILSPLEVLRISTVVDYLAESPLSEPFGSTKNFYCCRLYCARDADLPLEVLRISTVVDLRMRLHAIQPLEVLRISTVVDHRDNLRLFHLWKY